MKSSCLPAATKWCGGASNGVESLRGSPLLSCMELRAMNTPSDHESNTTTKTFRILGVAVLAAAFGVAPNPVFAQHGGGGGGGHSGGGGGGHASGGSSGGGHVSSGGSHAAVGSAARPVSGSFA